MQDDDRHPSEPSRRSVLRGGAAAGLVLPLVAACGSNPAASTPPKHAAGRRQTGPKPLVSTSRVPVGGGTILGDEQIVVTQPRSGHYEAFSAVCPHMQCLVGLVQHGVIVCPCHGSEFSIKDGSVVRGPAATPLPPVRIEVKDGEVLPA